MTVLVKFYLSPIRESPGKWADEQVAFQILCFFYKRRNMKFHLNLKLWQISIQISETRWKERKDLLLSARLFSYPQQTRQTHNNLCCVHHTTVSGFCVQRLYKIYGKMEAHFNLKTFKCWKLIEYTYAEMEQHAYGQASVQTKVMKF